MPTTTASSGTSPRTPTPSQPASTRCSTAVTACFSGSSCTTANRSSPERSAIKGRPQTGRNFAVGAHVGVVAHRRERDTVPVQLRLPHRRQHHRRRGLSGTELGRGDRPAQPAERHHASLFRSSRRDRDELRRHRARHRCIPERNGERVQHFKCDQSKVVGAHNLRFGFQAQYRKFYQSTPVGPRGEFTFNERATGTANNTTNAFADFLLGYCSTCTKQFCTANSNYTSPTFAPFVYDVYTSQQQAVAADVPALRVLRTLERNQQQRDLVRTWRRGKIAFHKVPADIPPSLRPLIIAQDNFYPASIVENDLKNFNPRLNTVYNLTDRTVVRAKFLHLLRQPEPQRAAVHPAHSSVLPERTNLSPTVTQLIQLMEDVP